MILKINLNNCNLYIGDVKKCVEYKDLKGLKVIKCDTYVKDAVLVGMARGRFLLLNEYENKKTTTVKMKPEKVNDLFVDFNNLRKADKNIVSDNKVLIREIRNK